MTDRCPHKTLTDLPCARPRDHDGAHTARGIDYARGSDYLDKIQILDLTGSMTASTKKHLLDAIRAKANKREGN